MKEEIKQKLVCNTLLSFIDEEDVSEQIDNTFKYILNMKQIRNQILVEGIIEIYGYQINNGFFDSINLTYYPETHEYIKNGTITNYLPDKVKELKR